MFQVRWSGENYHHAFATGSTYNLYLATADGTGNVIIWDVVSGQRRAELCDTQPSKPVLGLLQYYTQLISVKVTVRLHFYILHVIHGCNGITPNRSTYHINHSAEV
jgi:hypothetical protein